MIGFKEFSIMAWNIRGAASVVAKRHLKEYLQQFKPYMVILLETHVQFFKVKRFWNHTGYSVVNIVEASGHAGGIWWLSSSQGVDISVFHVNEQAVTCKIKKDTFEWWCTAIYASPIPSVRNQCWEYLCSLRQLIPGSWMLTGDFNEILLPSEVKGGDFYVNRALKFGSMIDNCNLIDLGFSGPKYTWHRNIQGRCKLSKHLDRTLADFSWRTYFPEATVRHLHRLYSDHNPILINLCESSLRRGTRPFRFEVVWVSRPLYYDVVEAWNQENGTAVNGLDCVKKASIAFNKQIFGNIFKREKIITNRLQGIQKALEKVDSISLINQEAELRKEMNQILWQEEVLWFQKSKAQWVQFGDGNTKFFHAQTIVRRKRNKVEGHYLFDGSWSNDEETIKTEAVNYFKKLFATTEVINPSGLILDGGPIIGEECVDALTRDIGKHEVWEALKFMKSFKSPEPDGFQPFFFKHYWHIVGDRVTEVVKKAFQQGTFDASISETLVVLIPKEDNPTIMNQFRPISLCNVLYKIKTKVLVNRLRPYIMNFVSPLQSSFIPGRGTHDNILVAQEIMHLIKKSKSKTGALAFKIDLEKAYDRVDWSFLKLALEDFGFPQAIIKLIMFCVSSSSLEWG